VTYSEDQNVWKKKKKKKKKKGNKYKYKRPVMWICLYLFRAATRDA